jgi:hypothetical protein
MISTPVYICKAFQHLGLTLVYKLEVLYTIKVLKMRQASFMCCGLGFTRYLLTIKTAYAISPLILSMIYIRDLTMH